MGSVNQSKVVGFFIGPLVAQRYSKPHRYHNTARCIVCFAFVNLGTTISNFSNSILFQRAEHLSVIILFVVKACRASRLVNDSLLVLNLLGRQAYESEYRSTQI